MNEKLAWINTIKAISIMGVYLLHAREYAGGVIC